MGRPPIDYDASILKTRPDKPVEAILELQKVVTEILRYRLDRTYKDVKTKTTAYSMDSESDRVILVDLSIISVNADIQFPRAEDADYVAYTVILIANHATPNTLTVSTKGAANINGSASLTTQTVYDSITVVSDGTNYFRTDVDLP